MSKRQELSRQHQSRKLNDLLQDGIARTRLNRHGTDPVWADRFRDWIVDCSEDEFLVSMTAGEEISVLELSIAAGFLSRFANDNLNPCEKLFPGSVAISSDEDGVSLVIRSSYAEDPGIDEDKLNDKLVRIRDTVVQAMAVQDLEARLAAMEHVADIMFKDVRSAV